MAEHIADAFDVDKDLNLLIQKITTNDKSKVRLKTIEILYDHLIWLSDKDKKLKTVTVKLQKLQTAVRKCQFSLLDLRNLTEISSLEKQIKDLQLKVQEYVCGIEGRNFEKIRDELKEYVSYMLKDTSSEWKTYLGTSFFEKRLELLMNEVLRDSYIGKNLRENFTYTVNQNPVEKTMTYLKKYKKCQAATEFLIFELRSILTDTFRNSTGEFDKKVADKLETLIGNRWLRNFLAHLAHGSRLCHELTDLPRVIAHDAHIFMDKGEAVVAFEDLSFRIHKDKRKWKQDNKSKDLFTVVLNSSYRVELLNAVKDVTGDATLLGEEIEEYLGTLTDKDFRRMIQKPAERVGLLKIFYEATDGSQKEKLKTKFKAYLRELTVEEFEEILVVFSKQNDFLDIVENIMGPKSLAKLVKKYFTKHKVRFNKMKKSENFEDYLQTLHHMAEHCSELSEILENRPSSEEHETLASRSFRLRCCLI